MNSAHSLLDAVSPYEEMVAYEYLWGQRNQTLKTLSELFQNTSQNPSAILRQAHPLCEVDPVFNDVRSLLSKKSGFSVAIFRDFSYPERLRQAKHPLELFYYKGDIGLVDSMCVSIVGSRKASPAGKARAARIAKELVKRGVTVVSGLALGIDTAALNAAIECGGRVIAVIGTPIDEYYPKENRALQDSIARHHLLISQVPFYRYATEHFKCHKLHFPARNVTMSALSQATIIVEAGETSGTLTQAQACFEQGRKLFIMNSCFNNPSLTWPQRFLERGAIRVHEVEDVLEPLGLK